MNAMTALLQVLQGDPTKAELNMGLLPRAWTQKTQFSLGTGAFQCLEELTHLRNFSRGHCKGVWKVRAAGSLRLSDQVPFPFKGKKK